MSGETRQGQQEEQEEEEEDVQDKVTEASERVEETSGGVEVETSEGTGVGVAEPEGEGEGREGETAGGVGDEGEDEGGDEDVARSGAAQCAKASADQTLLDGDAEGCKNKVRCRDSPAVPARLGTAKQLDSAEEEEEEEEEWVQVDTEGEQAEVEKRKKEQEQAEVEAKEVAADALLRAEVGGIEWTACWLLLAVAVQSGKYDARVRSVLRRLTREVGVPWRWVTASEVMLCAHIVQQAIDATKASAVAQTTAAAEPAKPKSLGSYERWGYVGGGAVLGGLVFAISGGLAVPAVIASMAFCGAAVGAHVAVGAGTAAGLTALVGVSFGGYGAGLVGHKVAHRIGDVEEFELDIVDVSIGVPIVIGVPGWLNDSQDNAWKVWDVALRDDASPSDGGDALALRFESRCLYNLGNLLSNYLKSQLKNWIQNQAGTMVLGAAYASLALPQKLVSWSGWIDNTWALCISRADQAGEMLAILLAQRPHGRRPVTLIGFGIGARLIFKCLTCLAEMGSKGLGIVESAILLGTPVSADAFQWSLAASVCAQRLVNGYCRNDWVLHFVYRAGTLLRTVAGLRPITFDNVDVLDKAASDGRETSSSSASASVSTSSSTMPAASSRLSSAASSIFTGKPKKQAPALHPAIENLDLTGVIKGHWDYREKLPELVRICGLSTAVSTPPPSSQEPRASVTATITDKLKTVKQSVTKAF